jgi:hypothetical protein
VRQTEFGGDDLCDAIGQKIGFAATRAARLASGDPRPSVEERYASGEAYVRAVVQSATTLREERLLLNEDVDRIVAGARTTARTWPPAAPASPR